MTAIQSLPNGVRFAMEPMASVRSCTIGVWIPIGSAHERANEAGVAHFLEHMLFKGTRRIGAIELADEINRLGGHFNAMTSQETICLYAQCIDEKAPAAIDLLGEMLFESSFPNEEAVRERNVILEEYKMYEDNPDDLIVDHFLRNLWPGSPLGRPVIGIPSTISGFSPKSISSFLGREFRASQVLVVLAGSFDAKTCRNSLRSRFGKPAPRSRPRSPKVKAPSRKVCQTTLRRDVEQAHFCFGADGPNRRSPDRYAFGLLNMLLGGGPSSRLFREVREKRGLAYSVHSFSQPFRHAGCFGVGGSTSPSTLAEVLRICRTEMKRLCAEPVGADELELVKGQIEDSMLMGLESTSARMMRLSDSILTLGRAADYRETLRAIRQVTPAEIRRAARKYLAGREMACAFIGPRGLRAPAIRPIEP